MIARANRIHKVHSSDKYSVGTLHVGEAVTRQQRRWLSCLGLIASFTVSTSRCNYFPLPTSRSHHIFILILLSPQSPCYPSLPLPLLATLVHAPPPPHRRHSADHAPQRVPEGSHSSLSARAISPSERC